VSDKAYCTARVHEPGSWGDSRCSRFSTSTDGLCGPHRAGAARRARAELKYEADSRQRSFAWRWQTRNPDRLFHGEWRCPLCWAIVQARGPDQTVPDVAADHQSFHGDDWLAYLAAGQSAEVEA
jgi:hypothetical protein